MSDAKTTISPDSSPVTENPSQESSRSRVEAGVASEAQIHQTYRRPLSLPTLFTWKVKLAAALLFFFLLVLFNIFGIQKSPEPPTRFEQWLNNIEILNRKNQLSEAALPQITLLISQETLERSGVSNHPTAIEWRIGGKQNIEKTLRLLQLMKESKIISDQRATIERIDTPHEESHDMHKEPISLTIAGGEEQFRVSFSPKEVRSNPPVQNFLKLFEVYSLASQANTDSLEK